MDPAQPLAPPEIADSVGYEPIAVYVDGTPDTDDVSVIVAFGRGPELMIDNRPSLDPGPIYTGLGDGTVVRSTWNSTEGRWTTTLAIAGPRIDSWALIDPTERPDLPVSDTTYVLAFYGDRCRPTHHEPASPAAPAPYRHRAYALRSARVARWWPLLADEYTWLPPGWSVSTDAVGGSRLYGPGVDLPLPDGATLVVASDPALRDEDEVTVLTSKQLAATWLQTGHPTATTIPEEA